MGKKDEKYLISNGTGYFRMDAGGMDFVPDKDLATKFRSLYRAHNHLNSTKKLHGCYIENFTTGKKIPASSDIYASCRITYSRETRHMVYNKTAGICAICGRALNYNKFTIDHIIPLSKGGTNAIDNLQPTCKVCNHIKQDILPDEFMDKIWEIFVFNMRSHYSTRYSQEFLRIRNEHRMKCDSKIDG